MCEQCLAETVTVAIIEGPPTPEATQQDLDLGRVTTGWYVAVATKAAYDFVPGDVFVGRINDPDMVLTDDLFDMEEWTAEDEDENALDHLRGGPVNSLSEYEDSPLASDRFIFGEGNTNIFHPDFETGGKGDWWVAVPSIVHDFEETFGAPPRGFGIWTAWPIAKVAEVFREHGVPYDKEGRLKWALENKENNDDS